MGQDSGDPLRKQDAATVENAIQYCMVSAITEKHSDLVRATICEAALLQRGGITRQTHTNYVKALSFDARRQRQKSF